MDTKVYPTPFSASELQAYLDRPHGRTRIDRALYERWQAAHAIKDYALSDSLRDQLFASGVVVHVKKDGGYDWEWRAAHGIEKVRYPNPDGPGFYTQVRTRIDRTLWLAWQAAHSAKDYKLSDTLREQLKAEGVVVHVKSNGGYGWLPAGRVKRNSTEA